MPPKKPSQESPLKKLEEAFKTASQSTKASLKESIAKFTTPFTEREEVKPTAEDIENNPYPDMLKKARKDADIENSLSALERKFEQDTMGIVGTAAKPTTYSDYIPKPTSNRPPTKKKEKVEKGL